MRRIPAALAMTVWSLGPAGATDTALDLYSQCAGGNRPLAATSISPSPGNRSTLAAMAEDNCRDQIVRSWDEALARGRPLCVSGGQTVSDSQLALIFLDWARRFPQYLGSPPNEALYAAWEDWFPCRRR